MPLDSGGLNDLQADTGDAGEPQRARAPDLQSGADVGQALRAMREHRGLTLDQLAETTRVRAGYLAAIEELRLDQLPSRPFVIGYIRAYAQALGADPDQAAERFKAEEPVLDEPLPEPVGVRDDRDPRLAAIIAAAVVIVAAIVAWNIVQRVMTETAPAPPTASETAAAKALANTTAGPVSLGAPLPAPVESTTPPPYVTPGLDKAVNADGQPLAPQTTAPAQPAVELGLPQTFTPRGQVYGVTPAQTAVILQALKPAFLVVHGADGSIYFARQLAEGEAYRAANIAGMTIDVSEPDAFQVFSGGASRGVLPQPLTPIAKLVAPAPPPPKPVATAQPAAAAAPGGKPAVAPLPTAKAATPATKPTAASATAGQKPGAPKPAPAAAAERKPVAGEKKPASIVTKPAATDPHKASGVDAHKPGGAEAHKATAAPAKAKAKVETPKEAPRPPAQDEQPPF